MTEMVEIVGNLCELEGVAKVNQSFFLNFMKKQTTKLKNIFPTDSCPDVDIVKDSHFFFNVKKT